VSQVLAELLTHHESIDHIVVVDNGSLEPIAQRVEESGWDSKISVIRLPENVGSAGGFAAGMQRAMQSSADMFWLLDDDNRPRPCALDRLLAAHQMMGGGVDVLLQCYRGDRYQYVAAATAGISPGIIPNSFQGLHIRNLMSKILNQFRSPPNNTQIRFPCMEIPCAPYGGLLLSRSWPERVGLPDQKFFVYLDDYDFTYRITRAGGRIYLCAVSELEDLDVSWSVQDPGARSIFSPTAPPMRVYYSLRNGTYLERQLSTSQTVYVINMTIALTALSFWALTTGQSLGALRKRYALVFRAIRDGWVGSLGTRNVF
jgi:glycosyltransferase involved in cell wall biosynthesis